MTARSKALVVAACVIAIAAAWVMRREPARRSAEPERPAQLPTVAALQPHGSPPIAAPPAQKTHAEAPLIAWGSAPGMLGQSAASESSPEGPLALAVTPRGDVLVLDQVNGRIARWDASGAPLAPWPIELRAPRDLAAGPHGEVAVLDPFAGSVLLLNGSTRTTLALRGAHLDDPALATSVSVEATGVWVEVGHAWNVHIAGADGRETAQEKRDGKASNDGRLWLSAGLAEARAGTAWVRALDAATGALRWQRRYEFSAPILRLALLDSFADGRIVFAAHVAREVTPGRFEGEAMEVLCLAPDGALSSSFSFPPPEGAPETMRELSAGPGGEIVYLHLTRAGARVLRGQCR